MFVLSRKVSRKEACFAMAYYVHCHFRRLDLVIFDVVNLQTIY